MRPTAIMITLCGMKNGVAVSSYDALKPLADEQRRAADPEELVWLSASAGTGKTQVLSARVLRLLLRSDDFKPELYQGRGD
jgi:UvrD/REP helicase N-terminal domain